MNTDDLKSKANAAQAAAAASVAEAKVASAEGVEALKEKAADIKDAAADKIGDIKDAAADKLGDVKEKAGGIFENLKGRRRQGRRLGRQTQKLNPLQQTQTQAGRYTSCLIVFPIPVRPPTGRYTAEEAFEKLRILSLRFSSRNFCKRFHSISLFFTRFLWHNVTTECTDMTRSIQYLGIMSLT